MAAEMDGGGACASGRGNARNAESLEDQRARRALATSVAATVADGFTRSIAFPPSATAAPPLPYVSPALAPPLPPSLSEYGDGYVDEAGRWHPTHLGHAAFATDAYDSTAFDTIGAGTAYHVRDGLGGGPDSYTPSARELAFEADLDLLNPGATRHLPPPIGRSPLAPRAAATPYLPPRSLRRRATPRPFPAVTPRPLRRYVPLRPERTLLVDMAAEAEAAAAAATAAGVMVWRGGGAAGSATAQPAEPLQEDAGLAAAREYEAMIWQLEIEAQSVQVRASRLPRQETAIPAASPPPMDWPLHHVVEGRHAQIWQLLEVEEALNEAANLVFALPPVLPPPPATHLPEAVQPQLMMLGAALSNLQLSCSTQQLELLNNQRELAQVTRAVDVSNPAACDALVRILSPVAREEHCSAQSKSPRVPRCTCRRSSHPAGPCSQAATHRTIPIAPSPRHPRITCARVTCSRRVVAGPDAGRTRAGIAGDRGEGAR